MNGFNILAILLCIVVYLLVGALIGTAIDYLDEDVKWAFSVFWAALVPLFATVCLIKVLIKLFKGDLFD